MAGVRKNLSSEGISEKAIDLISNSSGVTTKFPEISGTYFIDLGRMEG